MDYQKRKRRDRKAAIAKKQTASVQSQAGLRTAQRIGGVGVGRVTPSVFNVPSHPLIHAAASLERSVRRSRIEAKKTLPPVYRSAGTSLRLRAPKVKRWEASPVLGEDWSTRARDAGLPAFKERFNLDTCKERPTDSRRNRGKGGAKAPRFIPWCKE